MFHFVSFCYFFFVSVFLAAVVRQYVVVVVVHCIRGSLAYTPYIPDQLLFTSLLIHFIRHFSAVISAIDFSLTFTSNRIHCLLFTVVVFFIPLQFRSGLFSGFISMDVLFSNQMLATAIFSNSISLYLCVHASAGLCMYECLCDFICSTATCFTHLAI